VLIPLYILLLTTSGCSRLPWTVIWSSSTSLVGTTGLQIYFLVGKLIYTLLLCLLLLCLLHKNAVRFHPCVCFLTLCHLVVSYLLLLFFMCLLFFFIFAGFPQQLMPFLLGI
jgi:Ca2+/Na+ antiporter